ncbi:MAG: sugar-transfer associated ATP-grasp domain-containing protein [Dongiaceae bacterium]
MNRYFFPPPLPHFSASGTTEASRIIRSAYLKLAWSTSDRRRLIGYALATIAWPIVLVFTAALATARSGQRVARTSGKPRWRQFCEQIWLGMVHTIRPRTYYVFELHDPARFARAGSYLQRFETKGGLYSALKNQSAPRGHRKCLRDKLRLFERCRALKIPTPRVLLALSDGGLLSLEHDGCDLPPADLFIKSRGGGGGKGAELWRHAGEVWTRRRDALDSDALLDRALRRSHGDPVIIQSALRPHPAIAALSVGALPTARIVTIINERDEIEIAGAVFRMSVQPDIVVDNVHAGAIAAAIDANTGRLGLATDIGHGPCSAWHEDHPVTGQPIAGIVLPHWPAAVALARRAHRSMNDRPIIGWDVAILQEGPVLIEGNGLPDLNVLQRCQRAPAGDGRLGRLLAFHVERVLGHRPNPARPGDPIPDVANAGAPHAHLVTSASSGPRPSMQSRSRDGLARSR